MKDWVPIKGLTSEIIYSPNSQSSFNLIPLFHWFNIPIVTKQAMVWDPNTIESVYYKAYWALFIIVMLK